MASFFGFLKANRTISHSAPRSGRSFRRLALEALEARLNPVSAAFQVANLYQSFLNRGPDSGGLAGWTGALESRQVTLGQVTGEILNSAEHAGRTVRSSYEDYLGRSPDTAGYAAHVGALERGVAESRVIASILGSNEYFARQDRDNSRFVESLYIGLLGRTPDAAGMQAHLGALGRGVPRAAVAEAFLGSEEQGRNLTRFAYRELLGREATPAEQTAWARVFAGSVDGSNTLLAAIAGSPEGTSNLGTTDPLPGAVRNVELKQVDQDTAIVSWLEPKLSGSGSTPSLLRSTSAPSSKNKGATSYTVTVDNGTSSTTYPATSTTWMSIQGLRSDGSSTVTVTAHNVSGKGPATKAVTVDVPPSSASVWDLKKSYLPQEEIEPSGRLVIPAGSPWGNRVGFPAIPYEAIMASAPNYNPTVPSLELPIDVSQGPGTEGISVSMWVQATTPGMLLAANTAGGGSTIPYLWIDANGKVNGGLYGPGPITPATNGSFTLLTSTNADGANQIGSPLAITSQTSVVDNNWHHIAFVANASSQSLYVDGVLQGASSANYVESFTNQSTTTSPQSYGSNQIILTLAEPPQAGKPFNAMVYQGNPSSGSQAQQANATYTLSGIVPTDSKALGLKVTTTGIKNAGTGPNGQITLTQVNSATLNGTTLTLTMADAVIPGNDAGLISLTASYQTDEGAFSFAPNVQQPGGAARVDLTNATVSMGGTANPSTVTDSLSYPQPLTGAVDEVAFWRGGTISQAQVQQLVTQPVSVAVTGTTFPSGYSAPGITAPSVYLDFNSYNGTSFTSQAPASGGSQAAIPTGLITDIGTTIPTAPFGNTERLGRFVNYGIGTMSPLASGVISAPVPSTSPPPATALTRIFQVALNQGDALTITRPSASDTGRIRIAVTNDQGQKLFLTAANEDTLLGEIYPAGTLTLKARRTGTYLFSVEYDPDATSTQLGYYQTPGPLNSFQVLTNTFQFFDNGNNPIVSAYSDPSLPGLLQNNTGYVQGPGNYFPLWSDSTWFSQSFSTSELASAYNQLATTANLDFANLNGATLSQAATPWDIASWVQGLLNTSYTNCYGSLPAAPIADYYPAPGSPGYTPPATPQECVYQFLYNTNQARVQISNTLKQLYSDILAAADGIGTPAQEIANKITTNQQAFVTGETVSLPLKSNQQNMGEVAKTTAGETGIILLSDVMGEAAESPLGFSATYFSLTLLVNWIKLQQPTNTPQSSAFVSFVPVMQSLLNYQELSELGDSIDNNMGAFLNQIANSLSSQNYLTSVFSNYGLLNTMGSMSVTYQQGNSGYLTTAAKDLAGKQAWQTMIPATFTWNAVAPSDFPSGNITNGNFNWSTTQPDTSSNDAYESSYMTTGDFNNDGFPDMALSNGPAETVSILLAQPAYSSGTAPSSNNGYGYVQGWNYSDSSSFGSTTSTGLSNLTGIASADFNKDGFGDILVNSDSNVTGISFGSGTGTFDSYQSINLAGGKRPTQLVIADFNNDGLPDFTTVCTETNTVVVGINTTSVVGVTTPATDYNVSSNSTTTLSLPTGSARFTTYNIEGSSEAAWECIAVTDFNDDGFPDLALGGNGDLYQGVTLLENQGTTNAVWTGFNPALWVGSPNPASYTTYPTSGETLSPTTYYNNCNSLTAGDFDGDGSADDLALSTYATWGTLNEGLNYSGNPGLDAFPVGLVLVTNAFSDTPSWGTPYAPVTSTGYDTTYIQSVATLPSALVHRPNPSGITSSSTPDGLVYSIPNYSNPIQVIYDPRTLSAANGPTVNLIPNTNPSGSYLAYQQVVVDPSGMISAVINNGGKNTTTVGWSRNAVTNNPLATFVPGGQQDPTGTENLPAVVQILADAQGGQVISLPVSAYGLGTQVASPGFFLSSAPATILNSAQETVATGDMIFGWQLEDGLGNPIALDTLLGLFGAPGSSSSNGSPGAPILPSLWEPGSVMAADPAHPVKAFNNGWFMDTAQVGDAAATWSDAFFGWGKNVPDYSPRNLLPTLSPSATSVSSGIPYSANGFSWSNGGSLKVSAAQNSPPAALLTSQPTHLATSQPKSGELTITWDAPSFSYQNKPMDYIVRLYQGTGSQEIITKLKSATFSGLDQSQDVFLTVQPLTDLGRGQTASLLLQAGPTFTPKATDGLGFGIVTDGTPFSGGGFDGNGNAYSSQALNGANIGSFYGTNFQFGAANQPNFLRAAGQKITAPTGFQGNLITIAAAAVNGVASAQFTLNFTDGTTSQTSTQKFSDWTSSWDFPNETILATLAYMDTGDGSRRTVGNNLYGYAFAVPEGKTLESITLPTAFNLNILDIQFGSATCVQQDLSSNYSQYGIASKSNQLPNGKGFNSTGQYYASEELGTSVSSGNYYYTYPAAQSGNNGRNNFVQCSGQTIDLDSNTVAVGLVGAVWGSMGNQQTKNGTVTLNFTDGTIQSFNETFGPWSYNDAGSGTLISTQNYYYLQDGSQGDGLSTYVYEYVFNVPAGKTLKSITLPDSSTQFGLLAMSTIAIASGS